jgi:hypothetical protein
MWLHDAIESLLNDEPIQGKELFRLRQDSQQRISCKPGQRPRPLDYMAAVMHIANFTSPDSTLLLQQFTETGVVMRSGLILILPKVLATFLGVADRFIRDHLPIIGLIELSLDPFCLSAPGMRLL